ncbi:MAG: folylpolyglutamate synthase/dihydrofolate synthase family protein [Hyphomicrobiaceae bacterium]
MPNLDATLARLKTLHPLLIDLSLNRIVGLLSKLGDPQLHLPPVVHIAGTNGKGSTAAFLKAMAEAAGKRVHVYTSPHLVRFNERISIPGSDGVSRPVSDQYLALLLARVERANASAAMTFFEITTAAAFLGFSETPADLVILETGLGGNFDATNVIARPALTILTPISMDHADKLGATMSEIATTKAGILKHDTPAIISEQAADVHDVIRSRARAVRAPMTVWGEDFHAFEQSGRLVFQSDNEMLDLPLPALPGPHQIVNAATAIAAATALRSLGITDTAIARGLTAVYWPARMQRITTGPLVAQLPAGSELWLDGGHNPAGGEMLAATVGVLEERSSKPLYLIVGMMGQKDVQGFLSHFVGQVRAMKTVVIPGAHERPFDADGLASIACSLGFNATPALNVAQAISEINQLHQSESARILICGSLYLAGHVLALTEGTSAQSN